MALQVTLPWRLTKEFHLRSLAILIFGAVLAFLTIGPLVMIFYGSFLNGFPGQATSWTLDGYRTAFSSNGVYTALFNSVWLSAVRTILKVGLAVFFAWVIVRTDIPHKGIME